VSDRLDTDCVETGCLFDTHAHLTSPELLAHLDDVIGRCRMAGVARIITVGTNLADAREALEIAKRYPRTVYVAAGVHPHEADKVQDGDLEALGSLWDDPAVVAVGEIGLDYHYDLSDRRTQREVFRRQLEMAHPRNKPLAIHCRDALDDSIMALVDCGFADRPVVFHCFTGGADDAARIAEQGWRISFTGIVTFRRSIELQAIAREYRADWLMLETDSPYLAPEPVRGKRPNEPAHVAHIARFVAKLRQVTCDALARETSANSTAFFNLGPAARALDHCE